MSIAALLLMALIVFTVITWLRAFLLDLQERCGGLTVLLSGKDYAEAFVHASIVASLFAGFWFGAYSLAVWLAA